MIGTLAETYKAMKNGIYDFTKDGKCSSCGACCSAFLPLSKREIKEIKRYIKKHDIKPCDHKNGAPCATDIDFDLTCPFRDNVNRVCTIYSIRPLICRDFVCCNTKNQIKPSDGLFNTTRTVVDMWGFFA